MQEEQLSSIFGQLGDAGLARMVAGFYRRVAEDPVLQPMYPEQEMAAAEQRLLGFLTYRFGGPQDYLEERGHPRLRMRHAPFAINQDARDRWVQHMSAAIDEANIPSPAAETLRDFFAATATFLINRA